MQFDQPWPGARTPSVKPFFVAPPLLPLLPLFAPLGPPPMVTGAGGPPQLPRREQGKEIQPSVPEATQTGIVPGGEVATASIQVSSVPGEQGPSPSGSDSASGLFMR